MALNQILRKYTCGYTLTKSQEKISHQMYMYITKLFVKNENDLETLMWAVRIYSKHRDGIRLRKMRHNEKT